MRLPSDPGHRALRRGRHSQTNGVYFITTGTHRRIPWFRNIELTRLLCRNIANPNTLGDAENLCWVVMPDHLHLLLRLGDHALDRVMIRFKSRTARMLNLEIGRSGRFWSAGYYDHALRTEERVIHAARYIVANPLRAGLARRCGDYPYWNAAWL